MPGNWPLKNLCDLTYIKLLRILIRELREEKLWNNLSGFEGLFKVHRLLKYIQAFPKRKNVEDKNKANGDTRAILQETQELLISSVSLSMCLLRLKGTSLFLLFIHIENGFSLEKIIIFDMIYITPFSKMHLLPWKAQWFTI